MSQSPKCTHAQIPVEDFELDDVPQDVFLLGLLRAYAERIGLSASVLSTQFDPLAAQMLMMIEEEVIQPAKAPVAH